MREQIIEEIKLIKPFDAFENQQIQETITWIQSGAPIFRIQKPDIPYKHLISYFVLLDSLERKLVLVDHKIARLWLPGGGHVEPDEHPRVTAARECEEEFGITADFWQREPLFLSSDMTYDENDLPNHIDVCFWYIIKNANPVINFDPREFHDIRWFAFDEIPFERADPHMKRFVDKLCGKLDDDGLGL